MRRALFVPALLVFATGLAVLACGSEQGGRYEPLPIPAGCNPLAADWDCTLPWPSDVFLIDDPAMPSGRRVAPHQRALVHDVRDDAVVDPFSFQPVDGFSPLSPILVLFPDGVDPDGLVFHLDDVTRTLRGDSPTLLLDALTGEPVLHFAELDPRAETDDRRTLVIHPMVRLADERRYVVAISGLTDPDGALLSPPEGFRRIRDGEAGADPVLGPLAERYEADIFPLLTEAGVHRAGLQLAWDFTTSTEQQSLGEPLRVRELTLAWLAEHEPQVWIDEVAEDETEALGLRIEGRVQVPLFLQDTEPGARLVRDAQGQVIQNGTAEVPFSMAVPRSVWRRPAGAEPAGLIQYMHGFFGGRDQVLDGWMVDFADTYGHVLIGVDAWGMSAVDALPLVDDMISTPSEAMAFTDRVLQAMANHIVVGEAAAGPLRDRPELDPGDGPAWDSDRIYLWGISQGHILAGTYLALSPRIERAVLCVGGAAMTLMMFRARPFGPFLELMETVAPDPVELQKWVAMLQSGLDRIDPGRWAPRAMTDTLPGSPAVRRVLMEVGMADAQVPNLATHLHARALGLALLGPAPEQIPLLVEQLGPIAGSALVDHDFGLDPLSVAYAQPAAEGNQVHGDVPEMAPTLAQMGNFLRKDGVIENTCDGVCDPR